MERNRFSCAGCCGGIEVVTRVGIAVEGGGLDGGGYIHWEVVRCHCDCC